MTFSEEQRAWAVKRLQEAAKQAASSGEILLRWSYLLAMDGLRERAGIPLETDGRKIGSSPLRVIQKGLGTNPIAAAVAEEVLSELAPDRVKNSKLSRARLKADRDQRDTLWSMKDYAKANGVAALQNLVKKAVDQHVERYGPGPDRNIIGVDELAALLPQAPRQKPKKPKPERRKTGENVVTVAFPRR